MFDKGENKQVVTKVHNPYYVGFVDLFAGSLGKFSNSGSLQKHLIDEPTLTIDH